MKKITVLTLGLIFLTIGVAFTQEVQSTQQSVYEPIQVGNKHCPVSGREVGLMGPAFKYVYNGKVYNLCCPGCKSTFDSNPTKYSKIADGDVKI